MWARLVAWLHAWVAPPAVISKNEITQLGLSLAQLAELRAAGVKSIKLEGVDVEFFALDPDERRNNDTAKSLAAQQAWLNALSVDEAGKVRSQDSEVLFYGAS